LALSPDGRPFFSADAISDTVGVFDLSHRAQARRKGERDLFPRSFTLLSCLPRQNDLLIGSAKGRGSGPNPVAIKTKANGEPQYPYNLR